METRIGTTKVILVFININFMKEESLGFCLSENLKVN